jgi:hypothetical protein
MKASKSKLKIETLKIEIFSDQIRIQRQKFKITRTHVVSPDHGPKDYSKG